MSPLEMNKFQFKYFVAKFTIGDDCWEWTGAKTPQGYGTHCLNYKYWRAHRLAYVLLVGDIPEGLVLDHLCGNKGCVNPKHLEPVTQGENVRRSAQIRMAKKEAA